MRIDFCWWNTGLAPPRVNKVDPVHVRQVVDALNVIFKSRGIDIAFLGEVNSEALAQIQALMNDQNLIFSDSSTDDLSGNFRTGVVSRAKECTPMWIGNYSTLLALEKKRIGQRFELTLPDDSRVIFFLVHWPSRVMLPEEAHDRLVIGQRLREIIDDVLEDDPLAKILVLGDFNDEPYNFSISTALAATRDLSQVYRDKRLLYNPFWDHLPYRIQKPHGRDRECIGTYYYSSGKIHRWFTLDQILFSAGLATSKAWQVVDDDTGIWEDPKILGVGPGLSSTIDHLPIFGAIKKEET